MIRGTFTPFADKEWLLRYDKEMDLLHWGQPQTGQQEILNQFETEDEDEQDESEDPERGQRWRWDAH